MRGLLVRANFALTDTLPLKNGTFLTKIPSSQNLKVAIYKDFRISASKNRPKMGVVIADFSKFEVCLKALSVRF